MNMKLKLACILLALSGFLFSCSSNKCSDNPTPVDVLIRNMMSEKTFSIVLYDMEVDEGKGIYKHKYRVTKNIEDSLSKPVISEWKNIDKCFFAENVDNMGLELASKSSDGKVSKIPAPPGFNNAVGNPKYGEWKTDNSGNSFWSFYGRYMFMSHMFNMMGGRPVYRSTYYDYERYRSNPSTSGRAYYGSGTNRYGTTSASSRNMNPSFHQKRLSNTSSFKRKVSSNPSRYSRSSSRSGSSFRSRGGGFGK